jgi:hypothetical protein
MRLPQFTAEVSLYTSSGHYSGFDNSTSRSGTVMVQFDYSTFDSDYWAGLAEAHDTCQPPCRRTGILGLCLCPTALVDINGPKLAPGITR